MAMNYFRHFDRDKIRYDFLISSRNSGVGAYDDEVCELGGRVYHISSMRHLLRYQKEFRLFLREHPEYRIIHSNLDERSGIPLKIAQEEHVPIRIAHSHSTKVTDDVLAPLRNRVKRQVPKYATHYFACGQGAGRWLFGDEAVESGRVQIVQNAIDLNRYDYSASKRAGARQKLGIKDDQLTVGTVGRLEAVKNQEFLIRIFEQLVKQLPSSVLMIVGEGSLKSSLEQLVEELGLRNNVRFTGSVADDWNYMMAMDAFVMPSFYEGFPLALAEAQITGLPCYVSDRVPQEGDISGNVTFLPLERGAEFWAHAIAQRGKVSERLSQLEAARKAHLDISVEAQKLQEFYFDELKKALV